MSSKVSSPRAPAGSAGPPKGGLHCVDNAFLEDQRARTVGLHSCFLRSGGYRLFECLCLRNRFLICRLAHPTGSVQPVRAGIEFLGFRIYPDHRRLLSRNVRLARKRFRRLHRLYSTGQIAREEVTVSVRAWVAHAKHGDTWALRWALLEELRGMRRA